MVRILFVLILVLLVVFIPLGVLSMDSLINIPTSDIQYAYSLDSSPKSICVEPSCRGSPVSDMLVTGIIFINNATIVL